MKQHLSKDVLNPVKQGQLSLRKFQIFSRNFNEILGADIYCSLDSMSSSYCKNRKSKTTVKRLYTRAKFLPQGK
jgi:hypothetical protein